MSKKNTMPADLFETKYREETYPFFETEEGTLIGRGHQDKDEFAAAATRFEAVTSDGMVSREDVEWLYATVRFRKVPETSGEWWFTWSTPQAPVTASTPGAIAITVVER